MKKSETSRLFCSCFIAVFFLSGCTHFFENHPARTISQNDPYEFSTVARATQGDETFVILTFSGGGTRAAAFSYGVLEGLRKAHLPGTNRTVLEEVDVISTVSGGSFTGAYFTLFGERIFRDYKSKFLYRNIEKELLLGLLNPVNWYRLASPFFSRIDMAAELYDEGIFESKTFGALAEKGTRPFLIINATNLYQGARFEFTGEQFDYIGSDILSYPVARAVAASSAFPFLLSPVTLVNHPFPKDYKPSQADAMAGKDYWTNRERYVKAHNNMMFTDKTKHPYVHLMDGGLADNIGLRAVQDLYIRGGIRKKINDGSIRNLVVITVNAKSQPVQKFDLNESPPGLTAVGVKTCTLSMDNYSFETIESMKNLFSERIRAEQEIAGCQSVVDAYCKEKVTLPPLAGEGMRLYVIDIAFANLNDVKEKEFLENLPTTFHLKRDEVDRLIQAGESLLNTHPEFQSFMEDYRN